MTLIFICVHFYHYRLLCFRYFTIIFQWSFFKLFILLLHNYKHTIKIFTFCVYVCVMCKCIQQFLWNRDIYLLWLLLLCHVHIYINICVHIFMHIYLCGNENTTLKMGRYIYNAIKIIDWEWMNCKKIIIISSSNNNSIIPLSIDGEMLVGGKITNLGSTF